MPINETQRDDGKWGKQGFLERSKKIENRKKIYEEKLNFDKVEEQIKVIL